MPTFNKWVSHGFVVAVHRSGMSGSGKPHREALDTILAENENSSSVFFGKLNEQAAISGQSQGGLGTSAGSGYERFVTAVPIAGASRGAPKPTLFLTSQSDFMRTSAVNSYNRHRGPGTLLVARGTSHPSVPFQAELLQASTTWYRCFLNDNQEACTLIQGECSMCSDLTSLADYKYKNW